MWAKSRKFESTQVDGANRLRHADDIKLAELGYKSEFKREFSVSLIYTTTILCLLV